MLKIRVKVLEITTKTGTKFKAYRAVENTGKLVDLHFKKEVTNFPKTDCYILVQENNIHLQSNIQYPRYWVSKIEKIEPIIVTKTTALPFEVVEME